MPRPAAVLFLLLCGCGGGSGPAALPDFGSDEGLKIAQLVSGFDDARGDPAKFKKLFAGTAPTNRKDYDKFMYNVVAGSPKVDGDTATAAVELHNEANYELLATKDWTFTKVGDGWKIKSAPLK